MTTAVLGGRYGLNSVSGKGNGKESGIIVSGASQSTIAETVVIYLSSLLLGLQKGVDKEFFLLFTVLDENKSWYSNTNQVAAMLDSRLLSEDAVGFQDSNQMHGMGTECFCSQLQLRGYK